VVPLGVGVSRADKLLAAAPESVEDRDDTLTLLTPAARCTASLPERRYLMERADRVEIVESHQGLHG
jgi:hypothetical protein